jgi:3-oxoadipate enol-lactonase
MSTPQRLPTRGITINVRVEGSGPPLLFLGGSNFDLSLRAPVFDSDLPKHFTVAAADPRGLGQTDMPDGDWTMQDYAQDALDLIDALGWARVDVLGESFGAMTALHLAAHVPQRVNRIALSAGAPGGAGGSSYPIHELAQIVDQRERARAALEIMDCRFATQQIDDPQTADETIDKRVQSDSRFQSSHANAKGYPRLLAARAAHNAWDKLPGITAPTLIFAGRFDRQAPPDRAENMARALPNGTLHWVQGGHSICFANSEPVSLLLKSWT